MVFCLVFKGVYPPYSLSGPTTKKKTLLGLLFLLVAKFGSGSHAVLRHHLVKVGGGLECKFVDMLSKKFIFLKDMLVCNVSEF